MKQFLTFIISCILLTGCISTVVVTTTTPHTITRIDTIAGHIRLHMKPVAMPASSINNGFKPGDTIPVLKNHFIRLRKK